MVSKTTVVKNPSGIHARPASLFVQEASKYESSITVGKVGGDAKDAKDAKSILMVMSLGMACGCEIEIAADGADEAAAVDSLVALIESGCGE